MGHWNQTLVQPIEIGNERPVSGRGTGTPAVRRVGGADYIPADMMAVVNSNTKHTIKVNTIQFRIMVTRKNPGVRSRLILKGTAKITPLRS
jgi:hypothetical protein